MEAIDNRSELLLGEEKLSKVQNSEIAIFGLGGVGGTAFEALVRSGIKKIHAIDKDVVDPSNLNRQILFTKEDIGAKKVEVATKRASSIRPDVVVIPEEYLLSEDTLKEHNYTSCSFLIDAIDDVPAKLTLMKYAATHEIPLICSLGMGNRLDPSQVRLETLDKTSGDPLAKKIRYLARQEGLNLKKIMCVTSLELPLVKLRKPTSMMMVPSAAGLLIASYVITELSKTQN